MTPKEISDIKAKQLVVLNHVQTVDDKVSNNNHDKEKVATFLGSLY